jgi:hypothetical protein
VTTWVNYRDRPAGCIAIAAMWETAHRFGQGREEAAWFLKNSVTDGERGECVDPGENGAILGAGGDEGPGPPGRGKSGQLASDSGGG